MAELFSQYASGVQFTAGTIVGSATGASGINPIVDRLNSISDDDGVYSNLGSGTGIDISAGSVVELRNKTSYYSAQGQSFRPIDSSITFDTPGNFEMRNLVASNRTFSVGLNLPHNSVVTAAITYGSDSSNLWQMYRITNNGGAVSSMAFGNVNSQDTTINNETINNQTYSYVMQVSLSQEVWVDSTMITYTTDYD